MANTLNIQRNGAVGFIDWLDARELRSINVYLRPWLLKKLFHALECNWIPRMTRHAWGMVLESDAMRPVDIECKQDVGFGIVVFHGASILPKLHGEIFRWL